MSNERTLAKPIPIARNAQGVSPNNISVNTNKFSGGVKNVWRCTSSASETSSLKYHVADDVIASTFGARPNNFVSVGPDHVINIVPSSEYDLSPSPSYLYRASMPPLQTPLSVQCDEPFVPTSGCTGMLDRDESFRFHNFLLQQAGVTSSQAASYGVIDDVKPVMFDDEHEMSCSRSKPGYSSKLTVRVC